MSLEQALADNTAALKEHTAILRAAAGKGPVKASDAAIAAAAAGKAGTTKPPVGKKAVTLDDVKAKFGDYLGAEDDDERATRIDNMKTLLTHFGAAKASLLEKKDWPAALGFLAQLEAGEEPDYGDGDAGAGESESLV